MHLVTLMILLPHAALYEQPRLVNKYTNISACARDQVVVQLVARTKWPDALVLCRETGAPWESVRPEARP